MKIVDDTLKFRGKWSRKSLIMAMSFFFALVYEMVLPFFAIPTKEYVFSGLLILVGATLGLTVVDKVTKKAKEDEEFVG